MVCGMWYVVCGMAYLCMVWYASEASQRTDRQIYTGRGGKGRRGGLIDPPTLRGGGCSGGVGIWEFERWEFERCRGGGYGWEGMGESFC